MRDRRESECCLLAPNPLFPCCETSTFLPSSRHDASLSVLITRHGRDPGEEGYLLPDSAMWPLPLGFCSLLQRPPPCGEFLLCPRDSSQRYQVGGQIPSMVSDGAMFLGTDCPSRATWGFPVSSAQCHRELFHHPVGSCFTSSDEAWISVLLPMKWEHPIQI